MENDDLGFYEGLWIGFFTGGILMGILFILCGMG